jgi:hypothetical protein
MNFDVDDTLITLPSFPEMTREEQCAVADALATASECVDASAGAGRLAFD